MGRQSTLWAGLAMIAIMVGCKDESAEWLRRCEETEAKGDIANAWSHCSIAADQGSVAAKEKLKTLQPKYDALKAEEKAKEAEEKAKKTKAAEERRKAEQVAQAARVTALRQKVSVESYGFEKDGECTGKGLPPFRKNYSGGTYDEDELVALADGCVHLFQRRNNMNDSVFCCPGR